MKFPFAFMKFPFVLFRVEGESMMPTLRPHQRIFVCRWIKGGVGDIVVFKKNAKTMVKRIERIESDHIRGERIFVRGDNAKLSHDSEAYGCVERSQMIGKVCW